MMVLIIKSKFNIVKRFIKEWNPYELSFDCCKECGEITNISLEVKDYGKLTFIICESFLFSYIILKMLGY